MEPVPIEDYSDIEDIQVPEHEPSDKRPGVYSWMYSTIDPISANQGNEYIYVNQVEDSVFVMMKFSGTTSMMSITRTSTN